MAEANDTTDATIQVIELNMMDKSKYFPLAMASGFAIRTALYPLSLVKTRLQVQNKRTLYSGTWDAFRKITKLEGLSGLYRGYWVNSLLVLPQVAYITVYEGTRQKLKDLNVESTPLRSFLAGGSASIASQTFIVPIDIVTQHLMLLGSHHPLKDSSAHKAMKKTGQLNPLHINVDSLSKSRLGASLQVIKAVYRQHGILGFYKGYFVSLMVYCPHSAIWWFLYDQYSSLIASLSPVWVPRLVLQCIAAPLSGCTATILTNPLDVSRTRIQVKGSGTLVSTLGNLWKYEGIRLFTKALTARMTQSAIFSFSIILGYETIKRWSLLEEHKADVRW